jgi:hypothetical protein
MLAALTVSGCAPLRVSTFSEPGFDLKTYRSYAWAPDEQMSTGDPRLDNNRFFEERIVVDVEKALAARGFERANGGTPGLILHYHASVGQRVDVNAVDRRSGYASEGDSSVYDGGSLTIDFVDARTNRLVWRGWSDGSLEGLEDQRIMERHVDDAIARIMEKLPHRL